MRPEPAADGTPSTERRRYGSWPTPITADLVLASAVRLSDVFADGDAVLWAEARPAENGRVQLVRRASDGSTADLLPGTLSARTAVHEYGGGAWYARGGVVWFSDWADQRLYRLEPGAGQDGAPLALTPEAEEPRGDRYADLDLSPDGRRLVAVRERHPVGGRGAVDVRNELVLIDAAAPGVPELLVTGPDFVAAPRFAPDGTALAYLRWNHPAMPWDATELVVRSLADGTERVVAGGPGESVLEPRWGADGSLWFVSDRTNWWNLYRWTSDEGDRPEVILEAEIGEPAWLFGSARYALLDGGVLVFAASSDGRDVLNVRSADGSLATVDLPFSAFGSVRAAGPELGGGVLTVAGGPTSEPGIYRIGPDGGVTTLKAPRDLGLEEAFLSSPTHVSFASRVGTEHEGTAHSLFYPPAHPRFSGVEGERPPLLVVIHGGPTAAASPVLNLGLQFWTSRGFAVVDVNYGGCTGYGRAYREQLRGTWGIVDVADCIAAARSLAEQGLADPERLAIRGGSAGGYTTLAALARADTPFAAGADHFGVADLEALAAETHKFESRYLDALIGPYPQDRDVYVQRSPLSHVEEFTRPLIVLQGSEDAVVPPQQSELIVNALRAKRVPVAYLLFEGEQHGFRRAENIRRALEAELSFYAQILGFDLPADEGIEPVVIENLPVVG